MKGSFQLSGGHVLAALLAFFALVVAANAVFIVFAVRSYPGEREKKSYRQGLHYNEVLDARAGQAALGWRASIDEVVGEVGGAKLIVSIRKGDAAPLNGLNLAGTLVRPASEDGAEEFAFTPLGAGRYEAIVDAAQGAWDLTVTATSATGDRFQFENRLIVP